MSKQEHRVNVENGQYTFVVPTDGRRVRILRRGALCDGAEGETSKALHAIMCELDAARVIVKAARDSLRYTSEGCMPSRSLESALALHDRLTADDELPSAWCGLEYVVSEASAPAAACVGARVSTGLPPLDFVLGGGLVKGSTTLLVGAPGTGKTTLALQMLKGLGVRALYAIGKETLEQVAAKAKRISALSNWLYQLHVAETGQVEKILESARMLQAQVIVIDTVQMMRSEHVKGGPGSLKQLSECTRLLIDYARTTGTTLWFIGHLTASGDIAGPRTIEHSVDIVLRLDQEEGEERILSCPSKNRFGPANVDGVRLKLTANGFVG